MTQPIPIPIKSLHPAVVVPDSVLEVKGLKTHLFTDEGVIRAVDGASFSVPRGKTLCVVGESGCGKSMTARSILQVVDAPGRIVEGEVLFCGKGGEKVDIAKLKPSGVEIGAIRGNAISMIFQEPMTSLSPVHTIGDQIMEAIRVHEDVDKAKARERAIEMLRRVGIPRPDERIDAYTFELSGGMRQRACIAMALACDPELLIADEPTTALDVTTQANILDLVLELQAEFGMSVMFITHDLGVVAEIADDVVIMYLGIVVERGDVDSIFHDPQHPYTQALLRSIPRVGRGRKERLASIPGMVPHPFDRPAGCPFHTRCDRFMKGVCDADMPPVVKVKQDREVRCFLYVDKPDDAAQNDREEVL